MPSPSPAQPVDARAYIEVHGPTLRYAEVSASTRPGAPGHLRRLGTCDFGFDVAYALLHLPQSNELDQVMEAVREIFQASASPVLTVVAHPPRYVSFFTPVPDSLSEEERHLHVRHEARLFADVATLPENVRVEDVVVRPETLADDSRVTWHHVTHIHDAVHARLMLIAQEARRTRYALVDATRAAARVAQALAPADTKPDDFDLAIGIYARHAEFVLTRGGQWYLSHQAPIGHLADVTYFLFTVLGDVGLDPTALRTVWLYGEHTDPDQFADLKTLLGRDPQRLNPLRAYGLPAYSGNQAQLAAYVPCLGATLL